MASQGPNFPTSATGNTNAVGGGTLAWTNPQNIEAADGAFATVFIGGSGNCDDLIGTGFGFLIPATATINGILAEVNYRDTAGLQIVEAFVKLLKAGSAVGNNKSTFAFLPTTATTVSYGGSADLWGTTWTPSDINAANFGIALVYAGGAGPDNAEVDFARITVFFTVPAPTVTSCSPNNGPASGGNTVTVSGTNFVATPTSITFGGTAATNIAFSSATAVTCTAPVHAAGTVSVVVTNPDGQTGTGTNVYTYNPPPTITSCSPGSGATAGGNTVTVNGSNFVATPTSITFGGTAATNITFSSSTAVTCTAPVHAAGAVNVVVTNPDGQSGTGNNVYTYVNPPPNVTSCSPNGGSTAGGTSVTVTGTNFIATPTSITFGASAATSVTFVNSNTLTCLTPPHAAGAVNVVVTNPDGQMGTGVNVYTFSGAPTFISCSPSFGPAAGATNVTITGTNFLGTTGVTFGGVGATNVVFVNSTTVTCTTPAHSPVTVNVVVTDSDLQTATGVNAFLYIGTSSRFLSF
jgi:hypothetical protein